MKQKDHNLYQIDRATINLLKTEIGRLIFGEQNRKPSPMDLMPFVSEVMPPVTIINHFHRGEPRAYKAWPTICRDPIKEDRFYVFSPVGYDGQTYMPHKGTLLIGRNEENINGLLFAGGHSDPEYVFLPKDEGTALPEDYDPETSIHSMLNAGIQSPQSTYIFFKSVKGRDISELLPAESSRQRQFNLNGKPLMLDLPHSLAEENQVDRCLGASMTVPIVRNFGSMFVLAYRCDNPDQPIDFCPEGFEPMSSAEFQWMAADEQDSIIGIKLPPVPASLKNVFALRETAQTKQAEKVLACSPSAP